MGKKTDLMFPGDFITNEEVFLPGKGTFAEEGKVKSALVGDLSKNMDKRKVRVKSPFTVPAGYQKGDVVIGSVGKVRENLAFIDLVPVSRGNKRQAPSDLPALLHIKEVKDSYSKTMEAEVRPGDIVRARVIDVQPHTVYLSTKGKHYGVIKAFCVKCRHPLVKKGKGLVCPQCEWKDTRKTAEDYRSGKV